MRCSILKINAERYDAQCGKKQTRWNRSHLYIDTLEINKKETRTHFLKREYALEQG